MSKMYQVNSDSNPSLTSNRSNLVRVGDLDGSKMVGKINRFKFDIETIDKTVFERFTINQN